MTNFYIIVSIQEQNEVEAIRQAHRVAEMLQETAELRVSGEKRLVAVVTKRGEVLGLKEEPKPAKIVDTEDREEEYGS